MPKRLIKITDCDHPSVDIEKDVLRRQNIEVELEQCLTEEDVIRKCKDAQGLINQYAPITRKVLAELKELKFVVRYGVGVDNVDVEAATEFAVQICNVPDYGVQEVSDHALALLFNLIRKVSLLSEDVKKGNWDFQVSRPIRRTSELTLGVIGLGRIGYNVAKKASVMGWNVIGVDHKDYSDDPYVRQVDFATLLKEADMITIHVPLTEETKHMFRRETFKQMKDGSIIVNTARGPIIEETALIEAIRSGKLAGAGLDVLENEPPEADHPLFAYDNVILTPHSAWYAEESAYDLKRKAAEEAARLIEGEPIRYPVNRVASDRGEFIV
ncbi:MAG TPA: C-terminal binding protein [Bacillales bacterium]|nr:C-terminal binding protein [Bacillales bacterium]